MIIVEGPDGAGKTTLIEELRRQISELYLVPRHANTHGPITDLRNWVSRELAKPDKMPNAIYDRHALISEPIYGPTIRGSVEKGFDDSYWFRQSWKALLNKKPLFIFCLPPIELVERNVLESEQMDGVGRHLRSIYYQYHFLYLRMKIEVAEIIKWDYDWANGEGEWVNDHLANVIRRHEREVIN